jgi:glycerophosphoryl diester phosphodiesterase
MAFAGYGETQRRRARFRGAHRRAGAHGGVVYVLGCIPATLPTLAALALCSLVTVFLLASRINDRDQSVEPGSAQMSSFAAAVGAGAMRRGERDPTLDGDVGMQLLAGARLSASGDGDGGLSQTLGPSAAFCALPFDPLVCAHGTVGASHWPEASGVERPLPNTVPALAAAVAAGHECVEVDVSRSKDGHLVALHARELRRLTDNRHLNVGELTLEEILNLPVPGGGYSVATFAEAMATVMRRGLKQITVDFKEDDFSQGASFRRDEANAKAFGVAPKLSSVAKTRGFGQAVLSAIAAVDETGMGCLECVFWGKSDDVMLEILRENPEARVGFTVANFSRAIRDARLDSVDPLERELIHRASGSIKFARNKRSSTRNDAERESSSAGARVVAAVQSEMIEPALTKRLRAENVRDVYAWTVNDEASIRRVANHGVFGIVTDEPEEATRVVRLMRLMCDSPSVFGGFSSRDQPESRRRISATSDEGENKRRGRTESDANPARPRAWKARGRRASPGTRGRDEG